MTTSATDKPRFARAFMPSTALAMGLEFSEDMMHVQLTDGRVLSVPLAWSPRLLHASAEQHENFEIGGGGTGIHWPDIDEDLSVAGLMAGVNWRAA